MAVLSFYSEELTTENDKSRERWLVGWLVLGLTVYRDSITVDIEPSPREGERKKKDRREKKNVQITPPAPTASAIGPCPTIV